MGAGRGAARLWKIQEVFSVINILINWFLREVLFFIIKSEGCTLFLRIGNYRKKK